MTGWQVDPAGVAVVLADVGGQVNGTDGLVGVLTPDEVEQAVAWVSWGREHTRQVPRALEGLLARVGDDVGVVGARVEAGVAGVGAAVAAYQAGQRDMDGQQRAAMAAGGDLARVGHLGRWVR